MVDSWDDDAGGATEPLQRPCFTRAYENISMPYDSRRDGTR